MSAGRDAVRAAVERLASGRTRWIGIDGFGGAGKSTLAAWLADTVADVVVVHADDFAAPSVPEWDWGRLQRQLFDPLRAGRPARYQRWDWHTDSAAEWHDVPVGAVVVIEGVSATRRELDVAWDVRVWVEAPPDIRLRRALARDGAAAERTWRERWIPEELAWAQRDRPWERADLVLDGTTG